LSQVKVEPLDFFDAYDCGHENRARQSISIWAATSTSGTDCGQARPNAPSKRAVAAGGVKDSMPLIPGDPRGKLKIRAAYKKLQERDGFATAFDDYAQAI
jgi:hypothetical protein